MKLKDRIKTYNFWVSLSSAIFLLLKVLGGQFGFNVSESLFSDIVTSLCGILVILGIIVPPTSKINLSQNQFSDSEIQKIKVTDETYDSQVETLETITVPNEPISNPEESDFETQNAETENSEQSEIKDLNCLTENNITIDNTIILANESSNVETNQEIQMNNDAIFHENVEISSLDINELKSKTAEILSSYESLFEGNKEEYIELLQNQIKISQSK